MPVYQKHLRSIIIEGINHPQHREQPLKGFHIVLDAGNGGGGFLATEVLKPLGANIEGADLPSCGLVPCLPAVSGCQADICVLMTKPLSALSCCLGAHTLACGSALDADIQQARPPLLRAEASAGVPQAAHLEAWQQFSCS